MEDAIAKGPNFVFTRQYVLEKHGEEVRQEVLAQLDESILEIWSAKLYLRKNYPFSAFKQFAHKFFEVAKEESEDNYGE